MDKNLTVLEAKRYGIYSCREDATLLEVARRMVDEDISCLVVTDAGGYLDGIITHTDLVRVSLEEAEWPLKAVSDYMTRNVLTVTPAATLADVGRLLVEHCVHRVVVVDGEESAPALPVAVISSSDLVYHMVKGTDAEGAQ